MVIAILLYLRGGSWHGRSQRPYELIPGIEAGHPHDYLIHKGDCIGYWVPLPSSEYTPQGKLPAEFHAGCSEPSASFFPKHMDQWGHSYFWHPPHWPFPPPSMHCLTNPLQGAGVGHKPEWVIYTLHHLFPGHKLPNVESSQSGRANIPPLNLDTPSPYCEEVLSQWQGHASVPTIKGMTNSYQGTSSSEMPWTTN